MNFSHSLLNCLKRENYRIGLNRFGLPFIDEDADRRERSPKGEALSPVSVATAQETERACSHPKGDGGGGVRSGESKFGRAKEANKFDKIWKNEPEQNSLKR